MIAGVSPLLVGYAVMLTDSFTIGVWRAVFSLPYYLLSFWILVPIGLLENARSTLGIPYFQPSLVFVSAFWVVAGLIYLVFIKTRSWIPVSVLALIFGFSSFNYVWMDMGG